MKMSGSKKYSAVPVKVPVPEPPEARVKAKVPDTA
jgi:hypothetical protein